MKRILILIFIPMLALAGEPQSGPSLSIRGTSYKNIKVVSAKADEIRFIHDDGATSLSPSLFPDDFLTSIDFKGLVRKSVSVTVHNVKYTEVEVISATDAEIEFTHSKGREKLYTGAFPNAFLKTLKIDSYQELRCHEEARIIIKALEERGFIEQVRKDIAKGKEIAAALPDAKDYVQQWRDFSMDYQIHQIAPLSEDPEIFICTVQHAEHDDYRSWMPEIVIGPLKRKSGIFPLINSGYNEVVTIKTTDLLRLRVYFTEPTTAMGAALLKQEQLDSKAGQQR